MATILKGKNKGTVVTILQWCNDWFLVEPVGIVSPTNLQLNINEMSAIIYHDNNGILFEIYELTAGRTFKKRKR